MSPHPQVQKLLEAASRSPLPLYHTVPPFVARRIYRDTRGALAPQRPEVGQVRLLVTPATVPEPPTRPGPEGGCRGSVFFLAGGGAIGDFDTPDVLCRQP